MKYRKKPVVIEAVQWKGNNIKEIVELVQSEKLVRVRSCGILRILTPEGELDTGICDYVIRGEDGACRPYPQRKFCKEYEPVKEDL